MTRILNCGLTEEVVNNSETRDFAEHERVSEAEHFKS